MCSSVCCVCTNFVVVGYSLAMETLSDFGSQNEAVTISDKNNKLALNKDGIRIGRWLFLTRE